MTRTARTAHSAKRTPTKTPEYLERWSKESSTPTGATQFVRDRSWFVSKESSTGEKRRERQERRAAAGVHLSDSLYVWVCLSCVHLPVTLSLSLSLSVSVSLSLTHSLTHTHTHTHTWPHHRSAMRRPSRFLLEKLLS